MVIVKIYWMTIVDDAAFFIAKDVFIMENIATTSFNFIEHIVVIFKKKSSMVS